MASLLWRLQGSVFVQNCLKGRLCEGQSVCPVTSRYEEHRPALAHSIIAEHMEGTAGLRYTLPVFLSETCHSSCAAFPLTAKSLCEQLGISVHSPVGSFLAAHESTQTPDATEGEQRPAAIMLCMTCAARLPHGKACTFRLRSRHCAQQVLLETLESEEGFLCRWRGYFVAEPPEGCPGNSGWCFSSKC